MNIDLLYCKATPVIRVKNGIIIEANDRFSELTGFNATELLNRSLFTVWNKLFRINKALNFEDKETESILFTKELEVRFVTIKKYENINSGESFYMVTEKENSRLDNKLIFIDKMISDNKIGVGIFTTTDLVLVKANQTYLNYLPKPCNTKDIAYGKFLKEIIPDFEGSRAEWVWNNIIDKNESVYVTEKQGIMLGADDRYWDNTITPVSENGEVKYIISILQDVTERVLGREHIRIKNEQLEAIIDNLYDGVAIMDRYGVLIRTNKAIKEFMNIKTDVGSIIKRIEETIQFGQKYYNEQGEEISIQDIPFSSVLRGEKVKAQRIMIKNDLGKIYFDFDGIPIYNRNHELQLGIIIIKNMTEQINKNKEIEMQNKRFKAIIECMNDIVTIVDRNGNYVRRGELLNNAFGIRGRNFYDSTENIQFCDLNGRKVSTEELCVTRVLKGEKIRNHKRKMLKGKKEIFLSISGMPIFDENGDLEMGVMVAYDITELIQFNKQIENQQKLLLKAEEDKRYTLEKALAMKDEFISLISHEFKTPLNVIYSALQLIESVYMNQVPERVQTLLGNIKQNTFRQLRLVNNLLDITRLNSGRFKLSLKNIDVVSLTSLITQSVRLYSDQKNIEVLFECNLERRYIAMDDEKLERIILNLLSNAIKFTNEGENITVSLKEDTKINSIIIEVSDTGIGIPKDKQHIIFDRFGQVESELSRRAEGTGIGLSLVKHLVEVLDGKIELESELGKGSTFRIIIPMNECIEKEEYEACLDADSRLVNSIHVEFSDIYL